VLLSDFDFDLPEERIALRPVEPRDTARMLHVVPGGALELTHRSVRDLPALLAPGDVMIFNDTRVVPARLYAIRHRGELSAKVEILLHKREGASRWIVFAKPGKKLLPGDRVEFGAGALEATVISKEPSGDICLEFDRAGPALDAAIMALGEMPLPPYIAQKRPTDARDAADYQTVYAAHDGAVAAPTAGLHFTPELLARIDAAGIERHHVTLHVGAGTFLPVKTDDISEHRMHAEWGSVNAEVANSVNRAKERGGRVIAVGTTSLRLLESAATPEGQLQPFSGDTSIFITPGYRFRIVDRLMTNFHLPKSTLFMLVSAFAGQATMRRAYELAITEGYRFYSYGDSSLLERAE
jgi:S-adenosylmethionine:tRNA ribosyltransferase-isomerase